MKFFRVFLTLLTTAGVLISAFGPVSIVPAQAAPAPALGAYSAPASVGEPALPFEYSAPAIVAGTGHTCVLTTDGEVKRWGDNTSGQLGDNSTTQRDTPVDVSNGSSGTFNSVAALTAAVV